MLDESREATSDVVPLVGAPAPRQVIDALDETLRRVSASPSQVRLLLAELCESLVRWYSARTSDGAREDAMQRAPWLTADAVRLKQQQADLVLFARRLRTQAGREGSTTKTLVPQFDEFVSLYLAHEAAEGRFLEAAFPGPIWAEQD